MKDIAAVVAANLDLEEEVAGLEEEVMTLEHHKKSRDLLQQQINCLAPVVAKLQATQGNWANTNVVLIFALCSLSQKGIFLKVMEIQTPVEPAPDFMTSQSLCTTRIPAGHSWRKNNRKSHCSAEDRTVAGQTIQLKTEQQQWLHHRPVLIFARINFG